MRADLILLALLTGVPSAVAAATPESRDLTPTLTVASDATPTAPIYLNIRNDGVLLPRACPPGAIGWTWTDSTQMRRKWLKCISVGGTYPTFVHRDRSLGCLRSFHVSPSQSPGLTRFLTWLTWIIAQSAKWIELTGKRVSPSVERGVCDKLTSPRR